MITDADIKKMKEVFATKEDLKSFDKKFESIDKRFDDIDNRFIGIDKKFVSIDKRFESIDKRFDKMDQKIDNLAKSQQKNTEELIELITGGFNSFEERIVHIEEKVFSAN